MRVLMITQKIDPNDSMLGFVVSWVEQIAARVDHLDVLCLEQHHADLPSNVTVWSMGKEYGRNRLRELINFYQTLVRVLPKIDLIFTHMVPRYLVLAAPLAAILRKPQMLWYVHRQITAELKLALFLCDSVATAVPESFPLTSNKVKTLGHGINTDIFKPDPSCGLDRPPLLLQVGRMVPIKHHTTLIRALAALGVEAKVALVGEAPANGRAYVDQLQSLSKELGLEDRVEFTGRKTLDEVRELLVHASASINLSPVGLFDKAALESMMCNVPTIVTNSAFDPVLGEYALMLRIDGPEDVAGLTQKLTSLLTLAEDKRRRMAEQIGERARSRHSLTGLMDRLVILMEQTARRTIASQGQ
jgi:glycosyltransferase involved in cell wall biosynthesis